MNKDLTLVFSSYQSLHLLKKILKQFHNKYKTVIIENSLDKKTKNYLEKNFNNTQVIIPKENLGLAKSYNLGIKKAKTKFVFLNNPDMEITNKSIEDLIFCAKKINLTFLNYDDIKYKNLQQLKNLSVIDFVFNNGFKLKKIYT